MFKKFYTFEIITILIIIIIKKKYKKNFNINKKNFKKLSLIKRGKYLTKLGNCISCHTINGGRPFSGGVEIKTNFGIITTPNITNNKNYGIKNINLNKFKKILKTGISKNNKFLYPIFPYINYNNVKKKDIICIYLFLKTIKNENIINKPNNFKFPFHYNKLLLMWRIFFFKKISLKYKKLSLSLKRGQYIVETLGHCNMCHSKNNIMNAIIKNFNFLGNKIENWYATNLLTKIKVQKTLNILKNGFNKEKFIGGPMSIIINNSLQYISKIDLTSISLYLYNFFNKNLIYNKNNFKNIKLYKKFSFIKGKLIYKKYNCNKCHSKFILGKFPIYPKINNNIKTNNINNIKTMLKYTSNNNTFKNIFTSIMSNFINFIKNKNYKHIINYIHFIKN